jgi:hypothetical protein
MISPPAHIRDAPGITLGELAEVDGNRNPNPAVLSNVALYWQVSIHPGQRPHFDRAKSHSCCAVLPVVDFL